MKYRDMPQHRGISQTYILHNCIYIVQFNSVAQSCSTLRPHELQLTRPPCTSPTPGVYLHSCPLSQ